MVDGPVCGLHKMVFGMGVRFRFAWVSAGFAAFLCSLDMCLFLAVAVSTKLTNFLSMGGGYNGTRLYFCTYCLVLNGHA